MRFFLVLLALLLNCSPLFAQICQPVNVATDAQKKALLRDYIQECYQRHFFFEGKGAVKLVAYQDANGRSCWLLSAIIDDRYRTAPPATYAWFGNDVILVYQGTGNSTPLTVSGDTADRVACIRGVLGSRVYHYTDEHQFTTITDEKGNTRKVKVTHVSGGNVHNDLIIQFNKDGTVSKLIPV